MEKYRKFDDPSCGLNPFTPVNPQFKIEGWKYPLRLIFGFLLLILRIPCLCMILWTYSFLQVIKYLFLFPYIIRLLEKFFDSMCMKIVMSTSGFNSFKETYHREHANWSWEKQQKGQCDIIASNDSGDVILANSQCFADWAWLLLHHSPLFTKIVNVELANGETKVGLRTLGLFETFFSAIGLSFPETITSESSNVYYNIKDLINNSGIAHYKGRRPIVIHPEGTKTNGLGVLEINRDIVKMICEAGSLNGNLRIHTMRFDYDFKYFAPMNTTDSWGFKNVLNNVYQFTSKMKIQYYYNLEGVLLNCQSEKDKHEFIKRTLMTIRKEQSMKQSWTEHQEFLTYWNDTNKNDGSYTKKKKNN